VTFAYVTGWRINSEVLSIQWRQVDLRVRHRRRDSAAEEEDRATRVLPSPTDQGRRPRALGRPPYLRMRLLPGLAEGPSEGRMPRQHSARLPANGHPQHGPGRHSCRRTSKNAAI
jgi:hypothetical protein